MPTLESCPEILSLAVHELRTPASVVAGYLRMLRRDTNPLSDHQRKMVEEAERSCMRVVELVAQMSDLGKLDGGTIEFGRDRFDLFEALPELAEHVHPPPDREVRLEVRGEPAGAPVIGDRKRLGSAFDAIFRAILREQAAAGVVVAERRVEMSNGAGSAVVVIAEQSAVQAAYGAPTGPFDEQRGGLGLALPIARRVIEKHGGRLLAPRETGGRLAAIVSLPLSDRS